MRKEREAGGLNPYRHNRLICYTGMAIMAVGVVLLDELKQTRAAIVAPLLMMVGCIVLLVWLNREQRELKQMMLDSQARRAEFEKLLHQINEQNNE
jgi:choline-glycine betaine transporter